MPAMHGVGLELGEFLVEQPNTSMPVAVSGVRALIPGTSSYLCGRIALGDSVESVDGNGGTRSFLQEAMNGKQGSSCSIALRPPKTGHGEPAIKNVILIRGDAAYLGLMRSIEELTIRSALLQSRKEECIEQMAGVAHITGRAHRNIRSHNTSASREAMHVDNMSLLKYEILPPLKEISAEEKAEAAKAMTEREKDLRKRLEHACVQLNQVVAAGSHGNEDVSPVGYGEDGNLEILKEQHLDRLSGLAGELTNAKLLLSFAQRAAAISSDTMTNTVQKIDVGRKCGSTREGKDLQTITLHTTCTENECLCTATMPK
mmetsp:Transcript_15846/g.23256  ORF Transcript_15846/g.23256 Transcript_15846/m.23256 type:complete len:316 (+) Transcript_15846:76-1023(+)